MDRVTTPDVEAVSSSRRQALKFAGLSVAFVWLGTRGTAMAALSARRLPGDAAAAAADGSPPFAPNAFIRIDANGGVRLVMPNVEMGQAIYTGASMMLAEELGVELDQIQVEHSPPNEELYLQPLLGGQITGGSTSVRGTWQVLREAGAVARTLLIAAAANRWRVDAASCTVSRGVVHHAPSGRTLAYATVAEAAGKLPMPGKVALKAPKEFTLLGKPLRRVDSPGKVNGSMQFGIDVRVPGMKVATVKACPTFNGRFKAVDDKPARAIPGVVDVLHVDNAVAVVGNHFWAAKQGLDALDIEWDLGTNANLTTENLRAALAKSSNSGKSIVASQRGTKPAGTPIESTYKLPFLAHATMEPLNATVWVTADKCEIWVGTQVPARAVAIAAKVTGLRADQIVLHNHYIGGGFGRRLEVDFIEQAVTFAKQAPYPLKVVWTREEDIRQDILRPMYHDRISAIVDKNGNPTWFADRISGCSVLGRWAPGALRKDGLDGDAVECADELPYDVANHKVEWVGHDMPPGFLVGWWRGVGPNHNLFVVESFFDELAHRGGKDPAAYRRNLVSKSPRTRAVLDLAVEKSGWNTWKRNDRTGHGLALGEPFGSHICAVVEVAVTPQGEVKVKRIVIALDVGIAVNVNSIEAQVQGGLLFGLSAALFNSVTVKNGAIEQSNFHDYRALRINEVPLIEIHRVENEESPGGLGELATAIVAPALCNAVFDATGVRLYELPVDRSLLQTPNALKQVVEADLDVLRSVA